MTKYLHTGLTIRALGAEPEITITTPTRDLMRDTIDPLGMDVTPYLSGTRAVNFAHDHARLPIGKTVSLAKSAQGIRARFRWLEANPEARIVRGVFEEGVLGASVEFVPVASEPNRDGGYHYAKSVLTGWALTANPANLECVRMIKSLGLARGDDEVDLATLSRADVVAAFRTALVAKGVSPADASTNLAPPDTAWSAPSLADFTPDAWGDLTATEKRHIAGHYAWAAEMPPAAFGNLKLPHHRASDGAIVWRGVANAAARLNRANIPSDDMSAVKAHLARHYRAFEKVPPWEANASAWTGYELSLDDEEIDLATIGADEEDEFKGLTPTDVLTALKAVIGAETSRGVAKAVNDALGRVD